MKSVEHAVIQIEQKPDGLPRYTLLSDHPSLGEARAEARRVVSAGAVVRVVKSAEWHGGEVNWS